MVEKFPEKTPGEKLADRFDELLPADEARAAFAKGKFVFNVDFDISGKEYVSLFAKISRDTIEPGIAPYQKEIRWVRPILDGQSKEKGNDLHTYFKYDPTRPDRVQISSEIISDKEMEEFAHNFLKARKGDPHAGQRLDTSLDASAIVQSLTEHQASEHEINELMTTLDKIRMKS